MSYPGDLTDAQWEKIAPFLARPDPRGARDKRRKRRAAQARLYRLFAWPGQCRLPAKDHEKTVASAEARVWMAMRRLLVRRLA